MHDYQTVAVFTYPSELAPARAFLESEGITTYVRDELTVQVHNFYSNAIGGIRLEVPGNELDRASELLLAHGFGDHLVHGEPEPETEPVDMIEGAFGIRRNKSLYIALIIILAILLTWFSRSLW